MTRQRPIIPHFALSSSADQVPTYQPARTPASLLLACPSPPRHAPAAQPGLHQARRSSAPASHYPSRPGAPPPSAATREAPPRHPAQTRRSRPHPAPKSAAARYPEPNPPRQAPHEHAAAPPRHFHRDRVPHSPLARNRRLQPRPAAHSDHRTTPLSLRPPSGPPPLPALQCRPPHLPAAQQTPPVAALPEATPPADLRSGSAAAGNAWRTSRDERRQR